MMIRTHARPRRLFGRRVDTALLVLGALVSNGAIAQAQLVQIKTLPIAEGEQFSFFPSANQGMAGLSLALDDPLLDPFVNPAKGARLQGARFFGSPTFYSLSRNAGGGQTLPVGGLMTSPRAFGGALLVIQEVDANRADFGFPPPGPFLTSTLPGGQAFPAAEQTRTQRNNYAFGMAGTRLERLGVSVAGSVLWSGLHRIDGVDLLYAGSQSVRQRGKALDVRLGMLKEWAGNQSLEAVFLHNRLDMAHDVAFADQLWDPNQRFVLFQPRFEHNIDRNTAWGMHLAYQRPLADSGWRLGVALTSNLFSHPKLPNYEIAEIVRPIPWDPGHSAAYNFGLGISRSHGPTTFGVDAIYEPILSHTWGEAPEPIPTANGGTVPTGGKTTENHFRFSNAIVRTGLSHDLALDGVQFPVRLQAGVAVHTIHYWLRQFDHVQLTSRRQMEQWAEWTKTWGVSFRTSRIELRYFGRLTTGTGRPGISSRDDNNFVASPDALAAARTNIIAAPSGPLSLTNINVLTHQFSVSLPLR